MKSLTNILRRSQLTPLERVTALVHNKVQKDKTRKGLLSDAEVRSIAELWTPRGNEEVRRFNKYIALMNLESTMHMEMQMYCCSSDNMLLRNHRILDRMRNTYTSLEDFVHHDKAKEHIPTSESLRFLLRHSYLRYDTVLHLLTFYSLEPAIQKDLALLDEGVRFNYQYFQEEVFLYELFDGDTELDENRIQRLVSVIWDTLYSKKSKGQKYRFEKDGINIHHAFASLPVSDIIYACAQHLSIIVDQDEPESLEKYLDDLQNYADSKETTLEQVIKQCLSQWVHNGLFISKHTALYLSTTNDTWIGVTQKQHSKLFTLWYDELQKSKKYLDDLIDNQELQCTTYQDAIDGNISIITGESLYTSKRDLGFINDVKEQIRYLIPLANIFLFISKYSLPLKRLETMKAFVELAQEFSQIFDIDLSQKYVEPCDEFKMQVITINMNLLMVLEKVSECSYHSEIFKYALELDPYAFTFDTDEKSEVEEIVAKYKEEMEKNK